MRVMKIKHKILALINFCHNTWHRHSSQNPMNSWVTQCYGYGSTKASSYEKIKEDFRCIQNKLCPRRNFIWPFIGGRLILIMSLFVCLLFWPITTVNTKVKDSWLVCISALWPAEGVFLLLASIAVLCLQQLETAPTQGIELCEIKFIQVIIFLSEFIIHVHSFYYFE